MRILLLFLLVYLPTSAFADIQDGSPWLGAPCDVKGQIVYVNMRDWPNQCVPGTECQWYEFICTDLGSDGITLLGLKSSPTGLVWGPVR